MSDSQFAYSGLTLDELRSLAASPQVGTLHAMPQSFRALADRVGEVADLLTHTQVNMHNWWKGPAAEQAAAMLGQAAAEAREFHDTAMGAATAVSHCAQIVSEQQHQMMNVPEVAEPGVTDVVRQPTTPFEALEAARQDAAYQAAHEQAVQVVNGIAAQYVETRSRLSQIGIFRAENFVPATGAPHMETTATEPTAVNSSHGAEHQSSRNQRIGQHRYVPTQIGSSAQEALSDRKQTTALPTKSYHASSSSEPSSAAFPKSSSASDEAVYHRESQDVANEWAGANEPADAETTVNLRGGNRTTSFQSPTQLELRTPYELASSGPEHGSRNAPNANAIKDDSRRALERYTRAGTPEDVSNVTLPPKVEPTAEVQPNYPAQSRWPSNDNAAMIPPPYTSAGSVHRTREERGRRPAYLKERKSAWVTETIAAPADGVLTPDWFEWQ